MQHRDQPSKPFWKEMTLIDWVILFVVCSIVTEGLLY